MVKNLIFLVREPPKKWGFSVLAKKPEIYDTYNLNFFFSFQDSQGQTNIQQDIVPCNNISGRRLPVISTSS